MAVGGTVADILKSFVEPAAIRGAGKYVKAVRGAGLTGATDLSAVKSALKGDDLRQLVRSEAALDLVPSREEFGSLVRPILEDLRSSLGRMAPRGGEVVAPKNPILVELGAAPVAATKAGKKVKVDAYVAGLVKEGKYDEAIDNLYQQTRNLAVVSPMSFIEAAAGRGGSSLFYPLRGLRNQAWARQLDVPSRFLGRVSSPASAQAGPYLEEARTIMLAPFFKVNRKGEVVFDFVAAEKKLGAKALKEPGVKGSIDQALAYARSADYLNSTAGGLSSKTWPYDVLEADPLNPLAYVADTVDTVARVGGAPALLPANTVESILGQLPGRVLASRAGITPAAYQEIPWFTSRILRGEPASAIPFTKLGPEQMQMVAGGRYLPSLTAARSRAADTLLSPVRTREGLIHPEVRAALKEAEATMLSQVRAAPEDFPLYQQDRLGLLIPNRSSVEAIVVPRERRFVGPMETMIRQLGGTQ